MMSFGVIGVSIRGGNVDLLEAMTIPEDCRVQRLHGLREACGFTELVSLQTCNRAEFYYIGDHGCTSVEARNRVLDFFLKGNDKVRFEPTDIYCHASFRALRHLDRVASSLDSMMVGETQILGQVKQALSDARDADLAGPRLTNLFSEAFRVAKKVRRETPMGRYAVSMINLLHGAISGHLQGHEKPRVAMIGVGPMSVKLAGHLQESTPSSLVFVNRTVARAEELAERFDGSAMALTDFLADPPAVDVIFSATSSEVHVIDQAAGERLSRVRSGGPGPLLMIDFAIPRDIHPEVRDLAGVRCLDIPYFKEIADENRRERFKAVDAAERIIDEAIGRAHKDHAQSQFRPIMASTLNEGLAYAEAGLSRLFGTKLSHMESRDRELISHWVKQLVRYTNQLPLNALAEQTDTAKGECAFLAGYGCVRTRSETTLEADHPDANRCSKGDGGPCLAEATGHPHHHHNPHSGPESA